MIMLWIEKNFVKNVVKNCHYWNHWFLDTPTDSVLLFQVVKVHQDDLIELTNYISCSVTKQVLLRISADFALQLLKMYLNNSFPMYPFSTAWKQGVRKGCTGNEWVKNWLAVTQN